MFDYATRIKDLAAHRFCCSQTLMALALELKGSGNPEINRELIKAMNGLCGGIGGSGKDCGALTGSACVIGLFCGRGEIEAEAHDELNKMVRELVEWFEGEYGTVECNVIIDGDPIKRLGMCPDIMQSTFENAMRIMIEHEVEIG